MPALQEEIQKEGITDQDEIDMREQNGNPVKVMSSGYEGDSAKNSPNRSKTLFNNHLTMSPGRAAKPFFAGGKMRNLERLKWWEDYEAKDGRRTPHFTCQVCACNVQHRSPGQYRACNCLSSIYHLLRNEVV